MMKNGGGGEIRTHEGREPLAVFKTAAFNRSATPPDADALRAGEVDSTANSGERRRSATAQLCPQRGGERGRRVDHGMR